MNKKLILSLACLAVFGCSPKQLTSQSEITPIQDASGVQPPPATTDPITLESLKLRVSEYRSKYALNDVFTKLVDNRGNNFAALYGVRNFRAVLHGVYYRGGANNVYNTVDGVRANENPLPASGLKNLCEENFKDAVYLYSTNFASSPKSVSCANYRNEKNTMTYEQISPLSFKNNEKFIDKVFQVIKGKSAGPIYGHCWNGWHASGYVAAILLKQFCGYSDTKALNYWIKNTDGADAGNADIEKQVTVFRPIAKYQITADESALICP